MKQLDPLAARLLDNMSDDEEFPEELYLGVNFDIEERRSADGKSVLFFKAYQERYRLTDILEALEALAGRGWVTRRRMPDFPQCCGPTAVMFRLTDEGHDVWRSMVSPVVEEYYR